MKKIVLVILYLAVAFITGLSACHNAASNKKLQGTWKSKDGSILLKITDKHFVMENDSPVPEDYFVKGDTIYTSFEDNQPYTKFAIKKLTDREMSLLMPDDSVAIEFSK